MQKTNELTMKTEKMSKKKMMSSLLKSKRKRKKFKFALTPFSNKMPRTSKRTVILTFQMVSTREHFFSLTLARQNILHSRYPPKWPLVKKCLFSENKALISFGNNHVGFLANL